MIRPFELPCRAQHGADRAIARDTTSQPGRNPSRWPHADRRRGQGDEVVVGDRLIVDDVVKRTRGRALRGSHERRRNVLGANDIPEVGAIADHREPAGLAQAPDDLLGVPAPGSVDVARTDDHAWKPGLADEPLAVLLRAAVGGLDREWRVSLEDGAAGVAGDDRRGEHEPRCARDAAGVEQPPCASTLTSSIFRESRWVAISAARWMTPSG